MAERCANCKEPENQCCCSFGLSCHLTRLAGLTPWPVPIVARCRSRGTRLASTEPQRGICNGCLGMGYGAPRGTTR